MKTLTFAADPKDLLEVDGETVAGGESFTVSDERAAELLADASIPLKEGTRQLSKLTRAQLEDLALERGLNPGEYSNKPELIAALEAPIPDHTTTDASAD